MRSNRPLRRGYKAEEPQISFSEESAESEECTETTEQFEETEIFSSEIETEVTETQDETSYSEALETPESNNIHAMIKSSHMFRPEDEYREEEPKEIHYASRAERKKAHWRDRIKCKICGKSYTRSGATNHKRTEFHRTYQTMSEKFMEMMHK